MWELLYETFWDRLEHFCFNLCRDEARAEDLTQEVFLRALQNRTLINSFTERQCKAWLFTLRYTAGYNASEIGQLLSLPPGTVRSRLAQIRHRLKTELTED